VSTFLNANAQAEYLSAHRTHDHPKTQQIYERIQAILADQSLDDCFVALVCILTEVWNQATPKDQRRNQ
jgi:hypothetical protein